MGDLQDAVEFLPIGQEVNLSLERQGKRMEIKVKPRYVPAPVGRTPRIVPGPAPGALNPASPPPVLPPPGVLPDLPDD